MLAAWPLLSCASAPGAAASRGGPVAEQKPQQEVAPEAPERRLEPGVADSEAAVPEVPRDAPPPLEPLRRFTKAERKRIGRVQKHVSRAAHKHQIAPSLINGIIWVESKFERRARGRRGPRGLMQIMPRTARYVARQLRRKYRPYSASFNIDAGTYYFARMLERFDGNQVLALVAYHRGPARVRDWLQTTEPLPEVSRIYVQRVLSAAAAFGERLGLD